MAWISSSYPWPPPVPWFSFRARRGLDAFPGSHGEAVQAGPFSKALEFETFKTRVGDLLPEAASNPIEFEGFGNRAVHAASVALSSSSKAGRESPNS